MENTIISLKSRELFLSNHLIYILYENEALVVLAVIRTSNSNQWCVSISRSHVEAQKSRYYFILIRNQDFATTIT